MPEGLEAEIYRRAAQRLVGDRVARVDIDERQAMADEIRAVLPGSIVTDVRRRGKLVVLDTDAGHSLGLHFGMSGRLVVGDHAPIGQLEYASGRDDPAWDRLVVVFDGGMTLRVNDPRRWATFTLDPDVARLGADFLALTADIVDEAWRGRRAAVKAVLLDQHRIAGFGNLCVDEVLWQAAIAPACPAGELDGDAIARFADAAREHLPAMLERGGSHRGTIDPEVRASLPPCPRDGAPLERTTVGGRTTVWCPRHQSC